MRPQVSLLPYFGRHGHEEGEFYCPFFCADGFIHVYIGVRKYNVLFT